MDSTQWLRDYRAQGEAMVRRSQQFQRQLQDVSETATSSDGAVAVTVGPSGALRSLSFSPRIRLLAEAELAQVVLRMARQAQHRVAHRVAELVEPVSGPGEALAFLRGQLPPMQDEHRDRIGRPDQGLDDRDHNCDDDLDGDGGPFLR